MTGSYDHPIIGDLSSMKERKYDPDAYYSKKTNRHAFFKFYEKLKSELVKLGWKKFSPGSQCELWIKNGESSVIESFFVDPWMK